MRVEEIKGRVWAFVLYPDSCIDYKDMIYYLEKLGVPMAVSPLHNPDYNSEELKEKKGELKKHYHCLMYFDGQKTKKQLDKLLDMSSSSYDRQYFNWDLLCNKNNVLGKKSVKPFFLKVNSISCYFRYLIHLDNQSKQQFPCYKINRFVSDDEEKYNTIVLLNGFNEKDYLSRITDSEDKQIIRIVKENQFSNISELLRYLVMSNNYQLTNYIKRNMLFVRDFLLFDMFHYKKEKNS